MIFVEVQINDNKEKANVTISTSEYCLNKAGPSTGIDSRTPILKPKFVKDKKIKLPDITKNTNKVSIKQITYSKELKKTIHTRNVEKNNTLSNVINEKKNVFTVSKSSSSSAINQPKVSQKKLIELIMADNSSVIRSATSEMLKSKIKKKLAATNKKISLHTNVKDQKTKCLTEKADSKIGQHNLTEENHRHSTTKKEHSPTLKESKSKNLVPSKGK